MWLHKLEPHCTTLYRWPVQEFDDEGTATTEEYANTTPLRFGAMNRD